MGWQPWGCRWGPWTVTWQGWGRSCRMPGSLLGPVWWGGRLGRVQPAHSELPAVLLRTKIPWAGDRVGSSGGTGAAAWPGSPCAGRFGAERLWLVLS